MPKIMMQITSRDSRFFCREFCQNSSRISGGIRRNCHTACLMDASPLAVGLKDVRGGGRLRTIPYINNIRNSCFVVHVQNLPLPAKNQCPDRKTPRARRGAGRGWRGSRRRAQGRRQRPSGGTSPGAWGSTAKQV